MRNHKVQGKKTITNTAKYLIMASILMQFAIVWLYWYNDRAYRSHRESGYIGTLIVWLIIYVWVSSLFRAFSIASSSIGDVIISQIISIGIPDAIAYIALCLLGRGYVTIWPGLVCYITQVIVASIVSAITKKILMKRMIPQKTCVLYGSNYTRDNALAFAERLMEKFGHMFEANEIACIDEDDAKELIDKSELVVFAGIGYEQRKQYAKYCIDTNKVFYYIPEIEEILFQICVTKNLLDTPLQRFDFKNNHKAYLIAKRIIDVVIALIVFVITLPIMTLTAIAIKIEDGGPVFFRQLRVTKNEKTFNIVKFRSMVVDADKHGVRPTVQGDDRITKVGAFIRKTRIDELPQLVNIIKGDMSFVGPRPERIEHVEMYEAQLPEFKYRHMVQGGLTGYAQVYGKYNTSPEDKLKMDLMYIVDQSLYMDFRLFLLTLKTIFQNESTQGFKTTLGDNN